MFDVEIHLENRPGALAEMGEILERAGLSIEGGGGFVVGESGIMHFLFEDGSKAKNVLEREGIFVEAVREVLVQRLKQEVPGQLGKIARKMERAGINIEVVYSDHQNQLILVVDDPYKGGLISQAWKETR